MMTYVIGKLVLGDIATNDDDDVEGLEGSDAVTLHVPARLGVKEKVATPLEELVETPAREPLT